MSMVGMNLQLNKWENAIVLLTNTPTVTSTPHANKRTGINSTQLINKTIHLRAADQKFTRHL